MGLIVEGGNPRDPLPLQVTFIVLHLFFCKKKLDKKGGFKVYLPPPPPSIGSTVWNLIGVLHFMVPTVSASP